MNRCFICERDDIPDREMSASGGRCSACDRDYTAFRRAFKAEHGRWPTMKEFKSDEEQEIADGNL
jgi:hypothetical protein